MDEALFLVAEKLLLYDNEPSSPSQASPLILNSFSMKKNPAQQGSYIFISVARAVNFACVCVLRPRSLSLPLSVAALQLLVRECGFSTLLLLLAVVSFCIRWCE